MGNFANIEDARRHFCKDLFATSNGIVLEELDDEHSLCSLEIGDRHRNAYGGVMGGAIFTLADLAFAALSNNHHQLTVALDVNINYLSAVKGSKLFARARCVKSGRTTSVYCVEVSDDTGRDIALFTGTGYKL